MSEHDHSDHGDHGGQKPNRLINETSPYLQQHAYNPVDWYAWGPDALERAKSENRPILLSIGYSSCHWCHVMAHESFENPQIAVLMNDNFVNIKVDREERPDLDSIYMEAVQAMTGQGGWPMTVFLTPEGVPFYGGTYFPSQPRYNMPSFPQVLLGVSKMYKEQPEKITEHTDEMRRLMQATQAVPPGRHDPDPSMLDEATRTLVSQFDRVNGGLDGAPKFPQPMNLEFLLRQNVRTGDPGFLALVELTLDKMAAGGMYDQVGGGFHRYSVDDMWLVPHFEKMLYDNAQLARVYLAAYQLTHKPMYRRVVEETLDYVRREMTSPEGGFYSAQDADSEGEEGKFYVWTPQEITSVLGPDDAKLFNLVFGVSQKGNFEGRNILHLPRSLDTAAAALNEPLDQLEEVVRRGKDKLYEARSKRVWPGRDDKVLVSWNGLMLRAFAEAASILDRDDYRDVAKKNAEFIISTMVQRPEGATGEEMPDEVRLFRTYKGGKAHIDAFAEDYAFYANGLISLYEATFEPKWVAWATSMVTTLINHFWDRRMGAFFSTADYHEELVARPKDLYDNAIPSANSEATEDLLRLYLLTAEPDYERYAAEAMRPVLEFVGKAAAAFGRLLCALDFYLSSAAEVALIGDLMAPDMEEMVRAAWRNYIPNKVVAASQEGDTKAAEVVPLLADRPSVKGKATAYVCRNYICMAPTTDPEEVVRLLQGGQQSITDFEGTEV